MRALTMLAAALALLAVMTEPAAAKSKDQVAANCLSQHAARAVWPGVYLKYRVVDARRCWYARGKAMVAKKKPAAPRVRVASARQVPVVVPPVVPALPRVVVIEPPADVQRVERALCGGPCPRFDLDEPVFRALCGGLCPDFREPPPAARIDSVFDAFARGR